MLSPGAPAPIPRLDRPGALVTDLRAHLLPVLVAVIDPNWHAAYTFFATMISEAWRVAVGNVSVPSHTHGLQQGRRD